MSKANVNIVVNAPAASGADLTRPGQGRVLVTGDSKGFLRPKVKSIKISPFIVETLADIDVTATATPAVGTAYKFVIEQASAESQQNNQPNRYYITVVATSTNTTVFGNQVAAAVQGLIDSGELKASVTAIASGATILGLAGEPLLKVIQPVNMTVASGWAVVPSTSTDFAAVAATKTVTVEVGSTSGLAVGQLHLVKWTGAETINGKTGTVGAILRVSAILTGPARVQYVAQAVSANITGADGTVQRVASEAEGKGSDLIAERGIVGQNADIVAADVYHEVVVDYLEPTGETQTKEEGSPIQKSYFINTNDGASPLGANALALLTQFEYVNGYLNSAGSAADPLLL